MTRTPWNKNKSVGEAKKFTPLQIKLIQEKLAEECRLKELTLFNLGLATKMKANDLLQIKVVDIIQSPRNYEIAHDLIYRENKKEYAYLFSNREGFSWSRVYYAKLVKKWCKMIGLNPDGYSTKSVFLSDYK